VNDSTPQKIPNSKIHKNRPQRKHWIIGFAAFFLLGAVLVASYFWYVHYSPNPIAKSNSQSTKINQAVARAEQLANNGKMDEAVKSYDTAASQTSDSYQKSFLILSKATLFFDDKKYADALTIAKQAEGVNENSSVTYMIAQIYEAMGNKSDAILYYKKTIPLVDQSKPLAKNDIQLYQSRIKSLGGEAK
jgi:tetratricopeptide (TPR) repeat protein